MDYTEALEKSFEKVQYMVSTLHDFPHITEKGQWLTHVNGHWTGGFWTGLLWLNSYYSDEPAKLQAQALQWAKRFKSRENDNKTHDMGFIFGPSCVMGYHINGDAELLEMATRGAYNMKDLYNEKIGLILAWDEPHYENMAIVDTVMNLPLMVWIAEQKNLPEASRYLCSEV